MASTSPNSQSDGRLAIIAGYGQLPFDVALAAKDIGENPFVFKLVGEADQNWDGFETTAFQVGDFSYLKQQITQRCIKRIVMAGGVKKRPQISQVRPSLNTILALPSIIRKIISGGDDALLRGFIELIEAQGCKVVGAHEIVPDLLADIGTIGTHSADKTAKSDMKVAIEAALKLGELDIGQAAVAVSGRVVALEGLEGTDAMLSRVEGLRKAGRLPNGKKGVLVKFCKPKQDMRADLPTIGPETIEHAKRAGLAGIVLEAGKSFILHRDKTIKTADKEGLFILGAERDVA
ncbi:LpxI family protein [Lentilitoribacter sp. EG35]|uniref:LpxI family protein n=1 Tax=Lentilitoribacter sp. EG35 TaxID=3234192 RepID=UPI00346162B0